MTCAEISARLAELRSQMESLDSSIASETFDINTLTVVIGTADNYPDTPAPPYTDAICAARISYLQSIINPGNSNAVSALIAKYNQMITDLASLNGYQNARDAAQTEANSLVQQWNDNPECIGDP